MDLVISPHPTTTPAVVITVAGELDVVSGLLLRTTITRSLDEQCHQVCLDLRDVTFADAAGMQALARAQAEAAIRGAHLEITEWSEVLERIAEWTAARRIPLDRSPLAG